MHVNVAKELAALEAMTVNELRAKYAQVFGEETRVRGLSVETIGKKFAVTIAFDSEQDADAAAKLLQSAGAKSK